ncbi:hypothetical protein C4552_04770 [Candidatus Parcubacteria bacterium]|nr:MAG: hypothetical protein C4552_04770 [Candidatus Parcubacteria bacterium]
MISWNDLRARLREGLDKLLAVVPEGDAPELKLGYRDSGGWLPLPPEAADPLVLLREFVGPVVTLSRHRSPAQVRALLHQGVGQCLIAEDQSWHQAYVD